MLPLPDHLGLSTSQQSPPSSTRSVNFPSRPLQMTEYEIAPTHSMGFKGRQDTVLAHRKEKIRGQDYHHPLQSGYKVPINQAECQTTDVFKLWYRRRLLRVPRTARRSNQSILKEINPEHSLEGLMLKLKLQPFGHLM